MALFERNQLPHRSTLSRFLAALDQPTVEALRTLFQEDLLDRSPFASPGGRSTGRECNGQWWMWMEHDKLPASVRCRRRSRCLPLIVGSIRSVPLAIRGANVEKWCVW